VVSSRVVKIDGADSDTFLANPTELITTVLLVLMFRHSKCVHLLNEA